MKLEGTRRHLAAATMLAIALVAACSRTDPSAAPDGTTGTTAPGATAPVDYSTPGPYRVGRVEITIATDQCPEDPAGCPRNAIVYYPADAAAAAEGTRVEGYSTAVAFPESVRAVVPPEFIQEISLGDTEVLDAPAANGEAPFPLVLHSHGFGSFYLFESRTMAHLASWGMVVAAPDHKERSLVGQLLGTGGFDADADVEDLRNTLATLRDENVASDGVLYGAMDFEELGVTGHSAGGGAAGRLAADDLVDAYIGKAPVPPVSTGDGPPAEDPAARTAAVQTALASATPPEVPTMLLAAERDGAIPLASVQAIYDWFGAPKRLIVIADAGHNAFTDLCAPIRAQGGLMRYVDQLPALAPVLGLAEDGCVDGYLEPEAGEALINHTMVAQLRWVFGLDSTDVSLAPDYLESQFPAAFGSEQADPAPASP